MMPELKSGVSANFTNGAKREGVTNLWKDSGVPSTRELFFFLNHLEPHLLEYRNHSVSVRALHRMLFKQCVQPHRTMSIS